MHLEDEHTDWKARYEDLRLRNQRSIDWGEQTRAEQLAKQRDALLAQLAAAHQSICQLTEQNTALAQEAGRAFTQSDRDRTALIVEREEQARAAKT